MKKALIVGIDDYPSSSLIGCVNDARNMAELLSTNGDGSPNFDIVLETNVKTKGELLELIHKLFEVGDSEVSLFYFSGHGTDMLSGSLVTPDYNGRDVGVSMGDILTMANGSSSRNKIIILDCCFSGKMGESTVNSSNESVLGDGVTIMTASRRNEFSTENTETKQGIFTGLLIQGLKGGAADVGGNITPASLYSFVDQSLGEWEQRPLFKTNISRFLPIRSIEAKVPKKILRKLSQYFNDSLDEYPLDPSYEFTNDPNQAHELVKPYAKQENVNAFKELQLLESVGLIEPVGEDHMYFAAMNSKGCKLTPLGVHYWELSHDRRF